jgi:hypothetical protein
MKRRAWRKEAKLIIANYIAERLLQTDGAAELGQTEEETERLRKAIEAEVARLRR